MAQVRQQKNAAWPHYAQPAVIQQATVVNARTACEQLEQMARKLAAARAEISRYQTRLFACERQMLALRKENAALEAACEQAREEALQAAEQAEKLRAALQQADNVPAPEQEPAEEILPEFSAPDPARPDAAAPEPAAAPEEPERPVPVQAAAPQMPAEPEWKPETELEHLSVELMNWFDEMMGD